ncbi:hypothetical protein EJ05DRAFT_472507 [Pseudovirgaria hyperparasitica]|uniref:Uncharacterized protein n=1 Tax=Pseudovirgaria hyperparasitica TaxID=470096 RepID=A0A6A6WHG4_9PEZI|nr:uncharacterized protein EJ05DRAFT_472507 [Pseudovirgaria hyperparasitica]KAF2761524.1 hypothetical protein EJ05DRAFT_472507 [Pseudovirgaria hyperparasitica]
MSVSYPRSRLNIRIILGIYGCGQLVSPIGADDEILEAQPPDRGSDRYCAVALGQVLLYCGMVVVVGGSPVS